MLFAAACISAIYLLIMKLQSNPTLLIASGSVIGATISSPALVYNILLNRESHKENMRKRHIEYMPEMQKLLAMDVYQLVTCGVNSPYKTGGCTHQTLDPIGFIQDVISTNEIQHYFKREKANRESIFFESIARNYCQKYSSLEKQSEKFKCKDHFNSLFFNTGYSTIYRWIQN